MSLWFFFNFWTRGLDIGFFSTWRKKETVEYNRKQVWPTPESNSILKCSLGPKTCGVQNSLNSQQIFGQQNFGSQKCWVRKNIWVKNNFQSKKTWVSKNIASTKILGEAKFWAQNILCPKNFQLDLSDQSQVDLPVIAWFDLPQLYLICPDLI